MKSIRKLTVSLILGLMLLLAGAATVQAASVSKVTIKHVGKNGKQWSVLKGKTSAGKTVWTYRTSKQAFTELYSATHIVKGNRVYLIDDNQYIKLNKKTGKVLKKKPLPSDVWNATLKLDSKRNLYAIGYYDNILYKISPSGKVLWKRTFSSKYWWPYKIILKGSKVKVKFDCAGTIRTVTVKAKNGK